MNTAVASFQNFLRPADRNTSFSLSCAINETITLLKGEFMLNNVNVTYAFENSDLFVKGSEKKIVSWRIATKISFLLESKA